MLHYICNQAKKRRGTAPSRMGVQGTHRHDSEYLPVRIAIKGVHLDDWMGLQELQMGILRQLGKHLPVVGIIPEDHEVPIDFGRGIDPGGVAEVWHAVR